MELRVAGKYKILRKIGKGAFGEIYQGINIKSGEGVAVKLEPIKTRHPQLAYEAKVYKLLQGGIGIPKAHWFGVEGDFNALVMDLLGKSLENLFSATKSKFSLKTVLMLGEQMIQRVELIHSKQIIHRDLKPDNFTMGTRSNQNLLYAIDFGLAKRFKDPVSGMHIPYKEGKSLTGTARYASTFTHLGMEQSRRDDLESIGYVLIYFLKGSLPWQGINCKTKKEKYDKIKERKVGTSIEKLCQGCPEEFVTYMKYCRNLKFEENPDYALLLDLFRGLILRNSFEKNFQFDWILIMGSRGQDIDQKMQKKTLEVENRKQNPLATTIYTKKPDINQRVKFQLIQKKELVSGTFKIGQIPSSERSPTMKRSRIPLEFLLPHQFMKLFK